MSMPVYTVSIVDDHALFRRGVLDILRQSGRYQVLAEYASGREFLGQMQQVYPDLLLLDVQMPDESGLNILREIRKTDQRLKVVVLTASDDAQIILEAIQLGANGFLPKDTLPEVILSNLNDVLNGQTILHGQGITILAHQLRLNSHEATELLSESPELMDDHHVLFSEMTMREQETLLLIAKGLNNKLIARELGISDGTVKVYVKSLLRKLNVHSRLELSVWVHRHLKTIRNV
ncbi:response regulator transcription factor [Acinetobacter sp. S40]|uniref:response regulator n=1 Tax=Acinetobacter sp. S40 TaxID=2767434 RepID=UPI001D0EA365|nr:response regulator transcription factor [Acinetobacter sp. S40]MBJ9984714.1 response regulator transcription factor [Acinetobacter sp. S40]